MRVLVLGANGFIGGQVVGELVRAGFGVVALTRRRPRAVPLPAAKWIAADIARLRRPADWAALVAGCEAIVNCAGALQSGARDDVTALQRDAVIALVEAASKAGIRLFVNISAPVEGAGAATEFLATKRAADEHLKRSGLAHVILRPALVIGRNAHGGSALLRALAAFPGMIPVAFPRSRVRVAAMADVTGAVREALSGRIAAGSDLTIASPNDYALAEVVGLHRRWLGLAAAPVVAMPAWAAALAGDCADLLGLLGWRSPLRTTAMLIAGGGIGEHGRHAATLRPAASLEEILAANPAGVHDLWFARLYLLKPVIFGTLSAFWIASGAIALARFGETAALAERLGMSAAASHSVALATALADITIGCAIAARPLSRAALVAALALSGVYLAGATWLAPGLWLDPLGVLVKVIPAALLAVVALAIHEERP